MKRTPGTIPFNLRARVMRMMGIETMRALVVSDVTLLEIELMRAQRVAVAMASKQLSIYM